MTRLYLIRGPLDPERDLPAGTEAIEVDDDIYECFRAPHALDLERILPKGRA